MFATAVLGRGADRAGLTRLLRRFAPFIRSADLGLENRREPVDPASPPEDRDALLDYVFPDDSEMRRRHQQTGIVREYPPASRLGSAREIDGWRPPRDSHGRGQAGIGRREPLNHRR